MSRTTASRHANRPLGLAIACIAAAAAAVTGCSGAPQGAVASSARGATRPIASTPAAEGPRVAFNERAYVGQPDEQGHLKHTFSLHNSGTHDLKVLQISSSCSCSLPKLESKEIKPGTSEPLAIDMSVRDNMQESSIYVQTNDPIEPFVVLTMKSLGGLPDKLLFMPHTLTLRVAAGQVAEGALALRLESILPNFSPAALDDVRFETHDPRLVIEPAAPADASFAPVVVWPTDVPGRAGRTKSGALMVDLSPAKKLVIRTLRYRFRAGTEKGVKLLMVQARYGKGGKEGATTVGEDGHGHGETPAVGGASARPGGDAAKGDVLRTALLVVRLEVV